MKRFRLRALLLVLLMVFCVTQQSAEARSRGGSARGGGAAARAFDGPGVAVGNHNAAAGAINQAGQSGVRSWQGASASGNRSWSALPGIAPPAGNPAFGPQPSGPLPSGSRPAGALPTGVAPVTAAGVQGFLNGVPSPRGVGSGSAAAEASGIDPSAWQNAAPAAAPGNGQQRAWQQGDRQQGAWQSGPEPFSPAWYAEHPNVWQATHPHADAVAAASIAAASAWLAWNAPPPVASTATSTTVVADTGDTYATYISETPPAVASPTKAEEWLPLGVYRIDRVGLLVQLSVSRSGVVQGVQFDASGAQLSVRGVADATAQSLTWSAGDGVNYAATLTDLTSDAGHVTITGPAGAQSVPITRSP